MTSMKSALVALAALGAIFQLTSVECLAGELHFRYRDAEGEYHYVTSKQDVERIRNTHARVELLAYFSESGQMKDIRDRVTSHGYDVMITVDPDRDRERISKFNGAVGGADPGPGSTLEIVIAGNAASHPITVLSHEGCHISMWAFQGTLPEFNYGPDEVHFPDEITTESTAWMEGYADYCGARLGQQEGTVLLTICETTLSREPTTGVAKTVNKVVRFAGRRWYSSTDWADVTNYEDYLASEAIVALILKEIAEEDGIDDGAGKIEDLLVRKMPGEKPVKNLREFLELWAKDHKEDAEELAIIVDRNTNSQMDSETLKEIFGEEIDVEGIKRYNACVLETLCNKSQAQNDCSQLDPTSAALTTGDWEEGNSTPDIPDPWNFE